MPLWALYGRSRFERWQAWSAAHHGQAREHAARLIQYIQKDGLLQILESRSFSLKNLQTGEIEDFDTLVNRYIQLCEKTLPHYSAKKKVEQLSYVMSLIHQKAGFNYYENYSSVQIAQSRADLLEKIWDQNPHLSPAQVLRRTLLLSEVGLRFSFFWQNPEGSEPLLLKLFRAEALQNEELERLKNYTSQVRAALATSENVISLFSENQSFERAFRRAIGLGLSREQIQTLLEKHASAVELMISQYDFQQVSSQPRFRFDARFENELAYLAEEYANAGAANFISWHERLAKGGIQFLNEWVENPTALGVSLPQLHRLRQMRESWKRIQHATRIDSSSIDDAVRAVTELLSLSGNKSAQSALRISGSYGSFASREVKPIFEVVLQREKHFPATWEPRPASVALQEAAFETYLITQDWYNDVAFDDARNNLKWLRRWIRTPQERASLFQLKKISQNQLIELEGAIAQSQQDPLILAKQQEKVQELKLRLKRLEELGVAFINDKENFDTLNQLRKLRHQELAETMRVAQSSMVPVKSSNLIPAWAIPSMGRVGFHLPLGLGALGAYMGWRWLESAKQSPWMSSPELSFRQASFSLNTATTLALGGQIYGNKTASFIFKRALAPLAFLANTMEATSNLVEDTSIMLPSRYGLRQSLNVAGFGAGLWPWLSSNPSGWLIGGALLLSMGIGYVREKVVETDQVENLIRLIGDSLSIPSSGQFSWTEQHIVKIATKIIQDLHARGRWHSGVAIQLLLRMKQENFIERIEAKSWERDELLRRLLQPCFEALLSDLTHPMKATWMYYLGYQMFLMGMPSGRLYLSIGHKSFEHSVKKEGRANAFVQMVGLDSSYLNKMEEAAQVHAMNWQEILHLP